MTFFIPPTDIAKFISAAIFNFYTMFAVLNAPVNRAGRRRHIKRNFHVLCGQCFQIRAHFIGNVSNRRDAIGANYHRVHFSMLHQMSARVVRNDRVRHTKTSQLPSRQ